MPILLDTNQILRIAQPQSAEYPIVTRAVIKYLQAGDRPAICPQNIYEFWSVATRPPGTAGNGLGMTAEEADAEIEAFESFFHVLPDVPAVYNEWRGLMKTWKITGRQTHDARLIATMMTHGIPHLMTFDIDHFKRYEVKRYEVKRYEARGIVIANQPLKIIHPSDV